MDWNWFFVIILVLSVGVHFFGHGSCGGGHQHRRRGDQQPDEAEGHEHVDDREQQLAHHGCH